MRGGRIDREWLEGFIEPIQETLFAEISARRMSDAQIGRLAKPKISAQAVHQFRMQGRFAPLTAIQMLESLGYDVEIRFTRTKDYEPPPTPRSHRQVVRKFELDPFTRVG